MSVLSTVLSRTSFLLNGENIGEHMEDAFGEPMVDEAGEERSASICLSCKSPARLSFPDSCKAESRQRRGVFAKCESCRLFLRSCVSTESGDSMLRMPCSRLSLGDSGEKGGRDDHIRFNIWILDVIISCLKIPDIKLSIWPT